MSFFSYLVAWRMQSEAADKAVIISLVLASKTAPPTIDLSGLAGDIIAPVTNCLPIIVAVPSAVILTVMYAMFDCAHDQLRKMLLMVARYEIGQGT